MSSGAAADGEPQEKSFSWALDPPSRFLLVRPNTTEISDEYSLKRACIAALKQLYGVIGVGMDIDVLSFDKASGTAIVRCSSDHVHYVWASMTLANVNVRQCAGTLVALSHSSIHDLSPLLAAQFTVQ